MSSKSAARPKRATSPVVVWTGATELREHLTPVADLTNDPRNARMHDERSIRAVSESLTTYGQVKPIVVDVSGKVLAGNGTLAAAKVLNWTHVATVRFQGTPAQATAYAIADNRTAELSTWDNTVLAQLLSEMSDNHEALSTGFDDDELRALLKETNANDESSAEQTGKKGVSDAKREELLAGLRYLVVVECEGEANQAETLTKLEAQGLRCQLLIS